MALSGFRQIHGHISRVKKCFPSANFAAVVCEFFRGNLKQYTTFPESFNYCQTKRNIIFHTMRPDDVVRRLFLIALTFVIYVLQACVRSERIKSLPFILSLYPVYPGISSQKFLYVFYLSLVLGMCNQ